MSLDADERLARLRLARMEGVGPKTFHRLIGRFGSAVRARSAWPELARRAGRTPAPAPTVEAIEQEARAVRALGGRLLVAGDPDYPPLLALLPDAPPILAILGDIAALTRVGVAIVGGRNASANGRAIARQLAGELTTAGIAVVSGLARGVDSAAHLGALEADGVTVAAVAGGLDQPYPPENAALQARIAERGGLVLAESPLGTQPLSRHFPRRNRVIAGLAMGVVVVEAAPQSGSLITARLALENGRELFAVPGSPLDPRARGSNDLIRQGAHLTESAADILPNLPPAPLPPRHLFTETPPAPLSTEDAAPPSPAEGLAAILRDMLGPTPVPIDHLIRECGAPAASVMAALLDLEIGGELERLPGNRVAKLGSGLTS